MSKPPRQGSPRIIVPGPDLDPLGLEFVFIPPGRFIMGSPEHEPGRKEDESQHEVILTRGFLLLTTPVSRKQWCIVMKKRQTAAMRSNEEHPIEGVSWAECQEFIRRLNAMGKHTYRLPTEAEWEYACRAGASTAFASGDISELSCGRDPNLDAVGWYCGNSSGSLHPRAQKAPNAWGLYDMHGNICEWCQDRYGNYLPGGERNPSGCVTGTMKVCRGGSWFSNAKDCRSASRFSWPPGTRSDFVGFRIVREA